MIYVVEDNADIRDLVVYTLRMTGFSAAGFETGEKFFAELRNALPSLILLDIMLPGEDGLSILKKLKSGSSTRAVPVILVTAKTTEFDKVVGLDGGADDYISKPFGMMELVARVKAVLRRAGRAAEPDDALTLGPLRIFPSEHRAESAGVSIPLTPKEFALLAYLARNRGIVLSREKLLSEIWGFDFFGETRTVDAHVRSLRAKLGDAAGIIETVRGVGYRVIRDPDSNFRA